MNQLLTKNKDFLTKLFVIALPITMQNLLTTSLNFLDLFMIGQLGEKEVAAVGIGNQIFFLCLMFSVAMGSGASIFAAQYWGKKEISRIRAVLGIAISGGITVSMATLIIILIKPLFFVGIFNTEEIVLTLGETYLKTVIISLMFASFSFIYSSLLRGTEQVLIPMIGTITGLVTNTCLNFLLIFGNFGFPRLGVQGAAIATVIARIVEFSIIFAGPFIIKHPVTHRIHEVFSFSKEMVKQFYKKTAPIIAQTMFWFSGYTMYSVIYGRISTESLAAYNIVCSIERIYSMVFISLALACSVMVGNKIGAGDEKGAKEDSRKFLVIVSVFALLVAAVLIPIRGFITGFYNLSETSTIYIYHLLLVIAGLSVLKSVNIMFYIGILKAGGDTFFTMIVDTVGIWLIGVPIAAFAAFILKFPVHYIMTLAMVDEILKMGIGFYRFFSNKWIHNLTKQEEKS